MAAAAAAAAAEVRRILPCASQRRSLSAASARPFLRASPWRRFIPFYRDADEKTSECTRVLLGGHGRPQLSSGLGAQHRSSKSLSMVSEELVESGNLLQCGGHMDARDMLVELLQQALSLGVSSHKA
ncbi:hypothetical protein EJB05_15243, partial [Eragrostis curvula]